MATEKWWSCRSPFQALRLKHVKCFSSMGKTQKNLILWAEFWDSSNTHSYFDCRHECGTLWKQAPVTGLYLWSFPRDTHPLPAQGRAVLSKTLFHACWCIFQPVQTFMITVVINTGVLKSILHQVGLCNQRGPGVEPSAHSKGRKDMGWALFLLQLLICCPILGTLCCYYFPFACLVPCGCFGEGAAACCRSERAQCHH